MRRAAGSLLALLLVLALGSQAMADHSDAQAEQTEREESLKPWLIQWPSDGSQPEAFVLAEVEALTAASLEWLDSLSVDCPAWWAATRTSWELTAVAVRLARGGLPPEVISNVFMAVGMTRQVGKEGAEAC